MTAQKSLTRCLMGYLAYPVGQKVVLAQIVLVVAVVVALLQACRQQIVAARQAYLCQMLRQELLWQLALGKVASNLT